MTRIFLIGAPGTISSSTIIDLIERGDHIAIFSSGRTLSMPWFPAGDDGSFDAGFIDLPEWLDRRGASSQLQFYAGNRSQSADLRAALQEYEPTVVIDFVCFDPHTARAAAGLLPHSVQQFIFISTVDVYGYPLSHLPMGEHDAWQPALGAYAENKRLAEEALRSIPGLPLTVVRPAYSFGFPFLISFNSHAQGRHLFARLKAGRPLLVPGDGSTRMHVSSACDTGRIVACLAGSLDAIGKDYTAGHPTAITQAGYIQLLAAAAGVKPHLVHVPLETILSFPDPQIQHSLLHTLTRFDVAFSMERFRRDYPDFKWKYSLEDWARIYLRWNEEQGLIPDVDEEIVDDRVIGEVMGHG
jgi:nucleoside-diphosphate-sugar epimerase